MTDNDDTRQQAQRKAIGQRLPSSSRSYDGWLKYLGITLYQERNRRRREDKKPDDQQQDR